MIDAQQKLLKKGSLLRLLKIKTRREINLKFSISCLDNGVHYRALDGKKTYDTWQQGFQQIFQAVLDNKPFVQNVYQFVNREQVETYLYSLTHNLLIGVIEEKAVGMQVRDEDKEFIADFFKFAFVGLMLDWIRNGMKKDPQQIIDRLSILIEGDITRALNKYRIDKTYQIL